MECKEVCSFWRQNTIQRKYDINFDSHFDIFTICNSNKHLFLLSLSAIDKLPGKKNLNFSNRIFKCFINNGILIHSCDIRSYLNHTALTNFAKQILYMFKLAPNFIIKNKLY